MASVDDGRVNKENKQQILLRKMENISGAIDSSSRSIGCLLLLSYE